MKPSGELQKSAQIGPSLIVGARTGNPGAAMASPMNADNIQQISALSSTLHFNVASLRTISSLLLVTHKPIGPTHNRRVDFNVLCCFTDHALPAGQVLTPPLVTNNIPEACRYKTCPTPTHPANSYFGCVLFPERRPSLAYII